MSIVNQNIQNVQETIGKMPTMMNTVKLEKANISQGFRTGHSRGSSQRAKNSSLSAAGKAMIQGQNKFQTTVSH